VASAVLSLLAVVVTPGDAAAEPPHFIWTGGLFGGFVREPPVVDDFSTRAALTFPALDSQRFQFAHGFGLIGVDLRAAISVSPLVYIPLLGGRIGAPIGPGLRRNITTPDGTMVHVELQNAAWGELLLPGIGLRTISDDIRFGGSVQLALVAHAIRGALTHGPNTSEFTGTGSSFAVYGDVFVCPAKRRSTWICAYAAPALYTGGLDGPSAFGSGFLLGLRVDVD